VGEETDDLRDGNGTSAALEVVAQAGRLASAVFTTLSEEPREAAASALDCSCGHSEADECVIQAAQLLLELRAQEGSLAFVRKLATDAVEESVELTTLLDEP
jgi:hypothetical protein